MLLSIIIVNYKTPFFLLRCIDSLKNTIAHISYEIIVVDNCSKDNSEELILNKNKDVIWINNTKNEGFGRANNIGISKSQGEYILLLNSDIIIPKKTIEKCLIEVQRDKSIGALGCKLLNEDMSLQKSTYYHIADYKGLLESNLIYDYLLKKSKKSSKPIKAIMGAFMMIPKKIFNEVGLFDPDFFMYAEEIELCHRITKYGYKITYFDKVFAIHKHGASSSDKAWSTKQNYLSNALLFYKIKGIIGYVFYHFLFIINMVTNFFAMWFLDQNYRTDYWIMHQRFYSNFLYYCVIPFIYTRKIGNGKRFFKRN